MVVCCSTEDQSVSSLLTCVICQEYYDVDLRLPKLLDCHHTLCLPCLEVRFKVSFRDDFAYKVMYNYQLIDCCRGIKAKDEKSSRALTNAREGPA
jgi:hypothetical protein